MKNKFYIILAINWFLVINHGAPAAEVGQSIVEIHSLRKNILGKRALHRSGDILEAFHYANNVSSWKYPESKLHSLYCDPEDEYAENHFSKILAESMTVWPEDDEDLYPFGMYPYFFAGSNPYQFGRTENRVFQKEALVNNATKTNIETVLSWAPFLIYIAAWLYIQFLAMLILPLVGFILFRFVALPLGEFIGGKRTRKYLRQLVINIEISRRAWIRWLWPKDRKLPPWRYRTPKILRYSNEGSVPWELMEEKEMKKLNTKYPERWQLDKRLKKWKEKATNPECYAEKWVYKMIHRKLFRDRSFHVAPHRFKWGQSVTSTSSGTSTSSDDETDIAQRTETPSQEFKGAAMRRVSLAIGNPNSESKIPKLRENYKEKRKSVFAKRSLADELHTLKSSHRGIILDQRDKRWPAYTGAIYMKEALEGNRTPPSKYKPKGWNVLRLGFGPKKIYDKTIKSWKPIKTNLVLKKKEIDALARREVQVIGHDPNALGEISDTKVTYNLAVLNQLRNRKKSPMPRDLHGRVVPNKNRRISFVDAIKQVKNPFERRSSVFSDQTYTISQRESVAEDEDSVPIFPKNRSNQSIKSRLNSPPHPTVSVPKVNSESGLSTAVSSLQNKLDSAYDRMHPDHSNSHTQIHSPGIKKLKKAVHLEISEHHHKNKKMPFLQ